MRWLICLILLASPISFVAQRVEVQRIGAAEGVRINDIRAILYDSRGILWVGTYGDGLLYLRQGRFMNPAGANVLTGPYIKGLCEGENGEIQVHSERGLTTFDGRRWIESKSDETACLAGPVQFGINDTLQADLGTVYEARDDGLYGRGLLDTTASRFYDDNGLLDDTIQAIEFGNDDALWIGTRNNGLLRRSGSKMTCSDFFQPDKSWKPEKWGMHGFYGIRDSMLLMWAPDSGLSVLGPSPVSINTFVRFDDSHILANDAEGRLIQMSIDSLADYRVLAGSVNVAEMVVDRFGTVWIIDRSGNVSKVESLEGGLRWRRIYATVPVDDLVRVFPGDGDGMIIINPMSIWELRGNRVLELAQPGQRVTAAHLDLNQEIWVGTRDGRILHYDETSGLAEIGAAASITSRPIRFVHRVNTGLLVADDVWMYKVTMQGDASEVSEAIKLFDLPSTGFNDCMYANGSIYYTTGHRLCWVPLTAGGLSQVDEPVLFIRDIILPQGSVADIGYTSKLAPFMRQTEDISIPYRQNEIVFSWESIAAYPGDVAYWYRLNQDDSWHSLGGQSQLQLVSLGPGTYAFDVRACDSRMNCATLDEPWVFTIGKPWWQWWWIWILAVFAVFMVIRITVRRRIRIIRARADREVELARAKTRALELEQTAKQLQMRPHFISNALNAIQSLVINGKPDAAADELVKFSRMMRGMLDASRKDKISLEEEIELLERYVSVVGLAKGMNPSLKISVQDGLDTDIEIPPMLIQPIIENCIEHGGPGMHMSVSIKSEQLEITITDNGPGFMAGDIDKPSSVAMKLVRDRLNAVGGTLQMTNGSEGGAIVKLTLPSDNLMS